MNHIMLLSILLYLLIIYKMSVISLQIKAKHAYVNCKIFYIHLLLFKMTPMYLSESNSNLQKIGSLLVTNFSGWLAASSCLSKS